MQADRDALPLEPTPSHRSGHWYQTWLPRVAAAALVALAVISVATWIFSSTSGFLITVLISLFVAFALLPAVEVLTRRGWRRGLATGAVMLAGLIFGVLFAFALTQIIIGEVIRLVAEAPTYVREVSVWLQETFGIEINVDAMVGQLTEDRNRLTEFASNAVGGILGLATTTLGMVFQALTISLFVFYILADLPRLRETMLRRFPPEQQAHIDNITTITIDKVGGYVYSRLLLAVMSAAFHFGVFTLIGLPYTFALAAWVGLVSQFVPTIGTYLAGVLPLLIAVLENPTDAVWVAVGIIVYQQVENYLIAPRVTANTMNLHPAVGFGAVIVGASLLGGVGALLALPAAAIAAALIGAYGEDYEVISSSSIQSAQQSEDRRQATKAGGRRREKAPEPTSDGAG
ncbi:MAG: AI-2E family transporter, partial [Acidimicrobiia bacterium]|nr:AI-2E family transporter [Acidimicrobiia bacterium]